MNVTETELGEGDYEQRYSVRLGTVDLPFVRKPLTIEPPEGTICYVDNGPRLGAIPRQCVGTYKGGKWVGVKFEPTHWTVWEALSHGG